MKKFQLVYLVFIGLITLIVLLFHTFNLFDVTIDIVSIMLILILLLLPLIPNFKKIKWGEFEAEISSEKIKELEKSVKKITPLPKNKVKGYSEEEVKELGSYLLSLVEVDHILALAKLRMEIELVVKNVYKSIIKIQKKKCNIFNLSIMLSELFNDEKINKKLLNNAKEVIMVCNRAIHGESIKQNDAFSIIKIGIEIISYFYGYSAALKEFNLLEE